MAAMAADYVKIPVRFISLPSFRAAVPRGGRNTARKVALWQDIIWKIGTHIESYILNAELDDIDEDNWEETPRSDTHYFYLVGY